MDTYIKFNFIHYKGPRKFQTFGFARVHYNIMPKSSFLFQPHISQNWGLTKPCTVTKSIPVSRFTVHCQKQTCKLHVFF